MKNSFTSTWVVGRILTRMLRIIAGLNNRLLSDANALSSLQSV
jgi:hypothetical protein